MQTCGKSPKDLLLPGLKKHVANKTRGILLVLLDCRVLCTLIRACGLFVTSKFCVILYTKLTQVRHVTSTTACDRRLKDTDAIIELHCLILAPRKIRLWYRIKQIDRPHNVYLGKISSLRSKSDH